MQHHSPFESRFEYFPPTPPLSDTESTDKPQLEYCGDMANLVPHTAGQTTGANPGTSGAPSRVTLSLGNLPSKKDFTSPWPRTPSKVRSRIQLAFRFQPNSCILSPGRLRLILTIRHGQPIVGTTSTRLLMRQWESVFPPFLGRLLKTQPAP